MRDVGSADAGVRAEIPPSTLVVKDFVNSVDLAAGTDELGSPDALAAWLHGHGLLDEPPRLDDADLADALAVREGLRQLLLVNAGHPADDGTLRRFNATLARTALVVRFDGRGDRSLGPATARPVPSVVAALLAAVEDARTAGVWERLKVCARDECRWAYYDASRNRSGRWCSMADCGNRVKMQRAYAARLSRARG